MRSALGGAVLCAIFPFLVSISTSTNGVYRDWVALAAGGGAIVLAIVAAFVAFRSRRVRMWLACIPIMLVGGLQIARGLGVFADRPALATAATPRATPMDSRAVRSCPDADSCDNLAAALADTDPAASHAMTERACELGQQYDCMKVAAFDPDRAPAFFERACNLSYGDGCFQLANRTFEGDGVTSDAKKATELLQRGCKLGSRLACKEVAFGYHRGDILEQNDTKAFDLAATTCEAGAGVDLSDTIQIGAVCTFAADSIRDGRGTQRDPQRAQHFDEVAADYNRIGCEAHDTLCRNLAIAFEQGRGVGKDLKQARALYGRACDAGDFGACNNLALMFRAGEGGPKNVVGSRELLERACTNGIDVACKNRR